MLISRVSYRRKRTALAKLSIPEQVLGSAYQ